jgi:hypothetical protein
MSAESESKSKIEYIPGEPMKPEDNLSIRLQHIYQKLAFPEDLRAACAKENERVMKLLNDESKWKICHDAEWGARHNLKLGTMYIELDQNTELQVFDDEYYKTILYGYPLKIVWQINLGCMRLYKISYDP